MYIYIYIYIYILESSGHASRGLDSYRMQGASQNSSDGDQMLPCNNDVLELINNIS